MSEYCFWSDITTTFKGEEPIPHNELEIQRAVDRLVEGRTVIVIAHRLKTAPKGPNGKGDSF